MRAARPFSVVLALLSVAVVGAGIAWACTPQSFVDSVTPANGPAGTEVTVTAKGLPANEVARIRWNEAEGPLLASARANEQGTLMATARIPADAVAGAHSILVVPQEVRFTSRAAFRVTAAAAPEPVPGEPVTQPSTPAPGSAPGPAPADRPANPTPPATTAPPPNTARPPAAAPPSVVAPRPAPAGPGVRGPLVRVPNPATRSPAIAPATATLPAVTTTEFVAIADRASGQRVFAGSVAPAEQTTGSGSAAAAAAPGQRTAAAPAGPPTPSEATAAGDLWSGFASADTRPSLSAGGAVATGASSARAVGAGLLGLGLIVVAGAVGAMTLRRRGAHARR